MPADDVDLAHLLADHPDDVLDRVLEGTVLALFPGEPAERAGEHADVRGRDVAVDDEVDAVALAARLDEVGHPPEPEEIVGLEEPEAILAAEALTGLDLLPDERQMTIGKVHESSPSVKPTGRPDSTLGPSRQSRNAGSPGGVSQDERPPGDEGDRRRRSSRWILRSS